MNSYLRDEKIKILQEERRATHIRLQDLIEERKRSCAHPDIVFAKTSCSYNEIKVCTRCGHHAFYGYNGYYELGAKYSLPEIKWAEALNIRNKLTEC